MFPHIRPELSWRNAERLLEAMAEMCRVAEPPGERNLGDVPFAQMNVGEISTATFQPPFANPFGNRTAFCCENSMQVTHRNGCGGGDECGLSDGSGKCDSMKCSTRGCSCAQWPSLVWAASGRAMQPAKMSRYASRATIPSSALIPSASSYNEVASRNSVAPSPEFPRMRGSTGMELIRK